MIKIYTNTGKTVGYIDEEFESGAAEMVSCHNDGLEECTLNVDEISKHPNAFNSRFVGDYDIKSRIEDVINTINKQISYEVKDYKLKLGEGHVDGYYHMCLMLDKYIILRMSGKTDNIESVQESFYNNLFNDLLFKVSATEEVEEKFRYNLQDAIIKLRDKQ